MQKRDSKWHGTFLLGLLAGALALGGCAKANRTCKEAANRYGTCIAELLGPKMAELARGKEAEGIPACAKDRKTVRMYETCLPEKTCEGFMNCIESYAAKNGP